MAKNCAWTNFTRAVQSMLLLSFLLCSISSCRLSRDDPDQVASAFVESMMGNDAKAAKTLVSSERWDAIDSWMKTHRALNCSSREWETGTGGVGSYDEDSNTWNYGLLFQCVDSKNPFCFSIDDIVLQETEKGWLVVEWGSICEEMDYCLSCP